MNKRVVFLCLMFLGLLTLLVGCHNSDNNTNNVVNKEDEDLMEEIQNYIEENVSDVFANSITLPTTYSDTECQITWASQFGYISNTGEIIKRDTENAMDVLTCTITVGETTKSYDYIITVTPNTLEEYGEKFLSQFPRVIWEDVDTNEFNVTYDDVINIEWNSSKQELFTNLGAYTRPDEDTTLEINAIITAGTQYITQVTEIPVQGITVSQKFATFKTNFFNNGFIDTCLTNNTVLPTNYEGYDITWETGDENIVDLSGQVHQSVVERWVELVAHMEIEGNPLYFKIKCNVAPLDITNMNKQEILENYISLLTLDSYEQLAFRSYPNIVQTYGFINFFTNYDLEITQNIAPLSSAGRPGTLRYQTEYIVCHDTAMIASYQDALLVSNCCNTETRQASWHYSVGDDAIYQSIPLNEIAWHAGDGGTQFIMYDTGVKATALSPTITISSDRYFVLAGQKTNIAIPSQASVTTPVRGYGELVEIGDNGNYYMQAQYYNTDYGYIANQGGNKTSIGIESCVNSGSDYNVTVQQFAKLVTDLLITYDLDVDRVMQHGNMSGKPCPYAIQGNSWWSNFRDLVSIYKFGKDNFSDYKFNWTSNSDNLGNDGYIALAAQADDTISYTLVVKNANDETIYNNSFSTLLK